jgi:predicted dinucleotide-binding enzyme
MPVKVGVPGTGMVGRGHAAKLASLGHEVSLGTRDVARPVQGGLAALLGITPHLTLCRLPESVQKEPECNS